MAGFDPNQPRDEEGKWEIAGKAARKAAGVSITPGIDQYLQWRAAGSDRPDLLYKFGVSCPISPDRPLSAGHPKDTKKECYKNAFILAESNSDYTYVEGLAIPGFIGIPLEHAWVVDAKGHVIDTTWEDGIEYFGIPFELDFVRKIILETKTWGVIDWRSPTIQAASEAGRFPDDAIAKIDRRGK